MIRKINQLRQKKGFTFIEMLVVLAIFAIMLGVLIPLLSTNRALEDELKDYSKAFYSNIQELMLDEKVQGNPLPSTGTDLTSVSAYSVVSVMVYGNGATPVIKFGSMSSVDALDVLDPEDSSNVWSEFAKSLTKLEKYNGKDLYYTAIVDSKYRVLKVYCSLEECTTMWGVQFVENYYVGSNKVLTASYPRKYCEEDETAGTFPTFGAIAG
ncbi:MAG: type II secretion system GspH family protein [Firmicutes bacterium]|nr:type II secretion system GspH family protein [[Eubacterium] siraeum]MCM1487947.1 type II secretion system GspH family protein [Bacillota bacterium]